MRDPLEALDHAIMSGFVLSVSPKIPGAVIKALPAEWREALARLESGQARKHLSRLLRRG